MSSDEGEADIRSPSEPGLFPAIFSILVDIMNKQTSAEDETRVQQVIAWAFLMMQENRELKERLERLH